MKCFICNSCMTYYFTKTFSICDLTEVNYWQCANCGFCASKTHVDMTDDEWATLNTTFHTESHYRDDNPYNRNQRYFNQALMLCLMAKHDLIDHGPWLDWGSGIGAVARLLRDYFGNQLLTYDKYFTSEVNAISESRLVRKTFDLVVNMAVFEHVRDRNTLDEIESYVADSGCLGVHTLVPDTVPKDPNWMYLLPVHCAFHTNKSMQMLMNDWGYSCSVYNEYSKMWILFKQDVDSVESKVTTLNRSLGWEYLHFKRGFMDFWKDHH